MRYDLTISIVLYKSDIDTIKKVIESVYKTRLNFRLYLIDNSPTDELKTLKQDERTEYLYNNANLGFGKAHNIAMRLAMNESPYHIIINPDVYFDGRILEGIVDFMDNNKDVGQVMPKILYPDGQVQHLCKLLPTPVDLFLRRFFPWFPGAKERNEKYELIKSGYNKIMNIPYLSGCFMFLRTSVLKEVGLFDERIFMYIEDADLTRRIHKKYKTIFYPEAIVYHHYQKGSYKNLKLMMYNIHGAFVYFTKYGWIFDSERNRINKEVTKQYLNA